MAIKHPLQTKLALLLLPLSWLYSVLMFLRKKAYDCGILKKFASELPTICIGNISWGGTGKSPLTDYMISALTKRQKKCVLLTRGYKSELPSYPFLLNNLILENIKQEQEEAEKAKINGQKQEDHEYEFEDIELPDESVMMLRKHAQLEIIISADRVLGAKRVSAFANLASTKQSHLTKDHSQIALEPNPAHIYADFLLMDDGFQHLRMCSDYNIVLLDKDDLYPYDYFNGLFSNSYSWNKQIPLGTWREPLRALKRAHIFIVKCPQEEWQMIREYALEKLAPFQKPLFVFEMQIQSLDYLFHEEYISKGCDITSLQETKIPYALVCAIANPKQVEESLTSLLTYPPTKTIFLPDHSHFKKNMEDLKSILEEMPVICTEKDGAKLAYKTELAKTKYPLLMTNTKLNFYDSAFYDRKQDKNHALQLAYNFSCEEEVEDNDIICCKLKEDMYKQHEHVFSQSIADVLKPVDPYTLNDDFDPEYYKYQLHSTSIFPCHKKLANRFTRKLPKETPENISDFDHWLECNVFSIAPTKKLYKDYLS